MDWNSDGKRDWKDDTIMYHVVSESEKSGKETNISKNSSVKPKQTSSQSQNRSSQGKGKASGTTIFALFSLVYLSLWLPGDIPINTFTGMIGIGAIICLIVCFIGWLNG